MTANVVAALLGAGLGLFVVVVFLAGVYVGGLEPRVWRRSPRR